MSTKYLDSVGLAYLWGKIKAYVDAHSGGGASVLDYYPVGSYYETSDTNFNPNTAWGGTWSLETAGQVHVSAGTGYTVSGALTNTTDGGEATHTLDTTEIPAHTHGNKSLTGTWGNSTSRFPDTSSRSGIITNLSATRASYFSKTSNSAPNAYGFSIDASHEHSSVGGSGAHNNMQPYIVVNRWHRTA